MTTLTVRNAEIKTATVEIRALTIGGKQVTLAVFRQLVQERISAGTPMEAVWGRVNYCPDKACMVEEDGGWGRPRLVCVPHLHLVWQSGTELRRATVHRQTVQPEFWDRLRSLPQLFIAI